MVLAYMRPNAKWTASTTTHSLVALLRNEEVVAVNTGYPKAASKDKDSLNVDLELKSSRGRSLQHPTICTIFC